MTCIVDVNGDYSASERGSEVAHVRVVYVFQKTLTRGRYNKSNYPVQELRWKRRGGLIFERGVLAGHYGICCFIRPEIGGATH